MRADEKLTVSAIKADIGGYVGHTAADYLRRHGPFEPHRLPAEDLEYTTMPKILARLHERFHPARDGEPAAARTV